MNAGDACSGGPSGVGLSSCAGTVASRRARLGRTEVRQAKRAGAEEASMLPPNPVETWTYHLKGGMAKSMAVANETGSDRIRSGLDHMRRGLACGACLGAY